MMDVARIRRYIAAPVSAIIVLLVIWAIYIINDQRRLSNPYYVDKLYQKGFYVETVQPDGSWIMTRPLLDGSVRRTRVTPWQAEHARELKLKPKPVQPTVAPNASKPNTVYVPVGIIQVVPLSTQNAISVDPTKLSSIAASTQKAPTPGNVNGAGTVQPHNHTTLQQPVRTKRMTFRRRRKRRVQTEPEIAPNMPHWSACKVDRRGENHHQNTNPRTRRQRKSTLTKEARIEDIPEHERSEEWINEE
ncbi:hypothetical protein PSACC_00952 [Paramicrosporidium saccamoebae]|uniref:Uncharacterized protein n=1 Tax=Paramicrosporidium saccamoebae TaxID=1246581 RepID=A0A2H9TN89_9FUNG|nr:hypothetical protein PSACC_00952 [Paramicrosporidium saccamoebae]